MAEPTATTVPATSAPPRGLVLGAHTADPPGQMIARAADAQPQSPAVSVLQIMNDLEQRLTRRIDAIAAPPPLQPPLPPHIAAGGHGVNVTLPSFAQRIDQLADVTITNPTITGGSIASGAIAGAIRNEIASGSATIESLAATAATTSRLAVSGTTTSAGLRLSALNCSSLGNDGTLTTDAAGNVICAADDDGAGALAGIDTQVQFNDNGVLGADSTFTFDKAADRLTLLNASTSNLTARYASSTQGVFGSISLGTLSGFLKATAGSIATSAIDLASDATGTLAVASGGTGQTRFTTNALLLGTGTGALATTSAGLDGQVLALIAGVPTWVATSTLTTISGTLDVSKGGTALTAAPSYGQLLLGNSSGGYALVATSSLGLPTFAYPFLSDVTSSLLSFNGGLTAYASTTIGSGGQTGGLTISGGATTTGAAYFGGRVSVAIGGTAVMADFESTNANGGYISFRNGPTAIGDIGAGAQTFSGGTAGDFGITSRAGKLVLGTLSTQRLTIDTSGNVGIGISPGANSRLYLSGLQNTAGDSYLCWVSSGGAVGFSSAACNPSDARLKTAVTDLSDAGGLAFVQHLRPVTFEWKDQMLSVSQGPQIGFIAQDVAVLFPELVATTKGTTTITLADSTTEEVSQPLSIDYPKLVVPLVKAVQEMASISETFKVRLSAWLANADNSIEQIVAPVFKGERAELQQLCLGTVCVNENQLAALLDSGAPGRASAAASGGEPPTIDLNGANPVVWPIGTAWQDDLGALLVYGGQSETVYSTSTVDTTLSGTTTIDYWAFVPRAQLWLHTTRDVVVAPVDDTPLLTTSAALEEED